ELVGHTTLAHKTALVRIDDEPNALTLITSISDGISGPLLGPRQAYPRLRGLLAAPSARLFVLRDEPEAALLSQALRLGIQATLVVMPVPLYPHRSREMEGTAWALLLFFPEHSPVLTDLGEETEAWRSFLDAMVSLLGLALRDGGLDETLRERTRRMQI